MDNQRTNVSRPFHPHPRRRKLFIETLRKVPWLTLSPSDPYDAKKQTEQILAIYPIVSGQKATSANSILPRQSESAGGAAPVPKESLQNDLIDFGQNDAPSEPPRPAAPEIESTGEISGLLKSTGKVTEGPLIDFHNDLKKSVPVIRRSETTSSNDVFVDAKE